MTFIIIFITWLIFSFAVAYGAKNRGRSFGTYLALSIILSPLVGGIVLLMLGENKEGIENNSITEGSSKKCPYCAEIIKKEAKVCRYCGKDLPEETNNKAELFTLVTEDDKKTGFYTCAKCGRRNPFGNPRCIDCQTPKKEKE